MSRVFLDTNIILDMLTQERENHLISKELFSYLLLNDYEVVISEDMLSTIYYIANNKSATLKFFQVIQEEWVIMPYGKEIISQALAFALENKSDLEDTLQCFCAKANGCEYVITSDKKFVDCGIEIVDYKKWTDRKEEKRQNK